MSVRFDERVEVLTTDVATGADQCVTDFAPVDQVVEGAVQDTKVLAALTESRNVPSC